MTCKEGGVEVKSAKPATAVCNGKNGATGFTETLPTGKTETGTWGVEAPITTASTEFPLAISFPIPLAEGGGEEEVFFFGENEVANQEFGTSGCSWEQENVDAKPESTTPGTLCVFEQYQNPNGAQHISLSYFQAPGEGSVNGYAPSGAYVILAKASAATAAPTYAVGTWAVTAK